MLDVGCGYGRWAGLVQTNYWETVGGQPMSVDGFDAFLPNVQLCARKGIYRKVWQQRLPGKLHGSWDTVLACEILEHLDQQDVEPVLDMLESVAGQRIICTSPNWPYFRGGSDTFVGFNEFDAHKAYISRQYFIDRGYKVIGGGFGNPEHPLVQAIQGMTGEWKSALELLPRLLPELAHTIIAYKDIPPRPSLPAAETKSLTSPDGRSFLVPASETRAAFNLMWNEIYGAVCLYEDPDCGIAEGDVVVDLGATFGVFALWALERRSAGLVVSVEADPTNAICLLDNVESCGFGDRFAIINRAVYSHDEGVSFQLVPDSPSEHFVAALSPEAANPAQQLLVPSVTLDGMVQELGLSQVDVVKADLVGSEIEMLAGAAETLRQFKPRLMLRFRRPDQAERLRESVLRLRPDYRVKVVERLLSGKILVFW